MKLPATLPLLVGLACPCVLSAEESDAHLPRQVQVQVEFVELDHKDLTKLLFLSALEVADATPLRKTVAEMVKKGEANVLETMMVVARSGEKATSESIREFVYPTEYEPPDIPDEVNVPGEPDGKGVSPEELKWMGMLRTQFTPTAFETRNLGGTLEVEPGLSDDGRIVDLKFSPEIVWHTGNTVWAEDKDAHGNVSKVQMPQMYSLRVNTAITCIDGQYNLVAVLSPKDQDGVTDFTRKVMMFVKCDVVVVKETGK
ncbi:hypothetical protein [Haloferula sp. A504]|uniref:hypothetical protein n=1 Tax=Haloferula sp. A504 TaxID=3373601 RepID=UPI0031BECB08|nr:hypothetical protein [Verrucomicrobiaceae bacterium E54]